MKFINYLTSIAGVEIFPMISLLIFFAFFVALGMYVVRVDKTKLKYLEALPIEKENKEETES